MSRRCKYLLTHVLTFLVVLTNLNRQLAEERRLSLPISTFMQAVSRGSKQ